MRWFKHVSNSHNDEKLVLILDEFGPEGYGVWWLLIETIAKEMDKSDKCSLTYPIAKWAKSLCCSKKKTATFLKRFAEIPDNSEKKLIFLKYHGEETVGKLEICIPNLLKYRDEYSKKSGQAPDKTPTDSGAKIEIEIETEIDKHTKPTTAPRTKTELVFLPVFEEKEDLLKSIFPKHNFIVVKEGCLAHWRNLPPPADPYQQIYKWFQREQTDQPSFHGKPKQGFKGISDDFKKAFLETD